MNTIDQGAFSKINKSFNMMTDMAMEEEFIMEELKKAENASKKHSPGHDQYEFPNPATRRNPKGFTPHPDSDIPQDINDSKARREHRQSKKIRNKPGGHLTPPTSTFLPSKHNRSDGEPSTPSACTKVFNALSGIPEFHHALVKVLGGKSNTDQELIRARNE
jgi:hypothetical protein